MAAFPFTRVWQMTSRTKPQKPSSCSTICRNAEKWIPQLLVDSFRFPQAQCIGHFWYDVDGNYKTPDESVIISLSSFNGAGVESLERWFEQPPCWSLQMKFNSCCQVFKLTNSPRIWLSPGTFQPLTTPLFTALYSTFYQVIFFLFNQKKKEEFFYTFLLSSSR